MTGGDDPDPGFFGRIWNWIFPKKKKPIFEVGPVQDIEVRTPLLRLPSFDGNQVSLIDKALEDVDKVLPNLPKVEGAFMGAKTVTTSGFKIEGQLVQIFGNRKLFLNWLKNNHSLSRINAPLNADEAQQLIDQANKLGMIMDNNRKGLQGLEITGQWGGIHHFKIGNVHIPIQPGLEDILIFEP